MLAFFVTAIVAFIFYLLLTFGSGTIGAWSLEEWISGAVLSLIVGAIAARVAFVQNRDGKKSSLRMLNPLRLLLFLVYLIGPFLWAMAKAEQGDHAKASTYFEKAVAWMQQNQPDNLELKRLRCEVEQLLDIPAGRE